MRRSILSAIIATGLCLSGAQAQTTDHQTAQTAVSSGALPASNARPNAFDDWVQELMREWKVPGVAVGAIRDGQVVFTEGYGYRNVENQLPVTPRTVMAIGSNSKSFTVVLMGQLVDAEQLDWDKPIRTYMPDFQLHDDYVSEHMRVRDLVTHVSGLPRHDALWYGRSLNREELFSRLRYLEPTTSFRGRWQYQNLMFMTAGLLVERLSDRTWDTLIREKIFQPLNMSRSNTSVRDTPSADDFAYPYVLRDGELERVPFRNIDNVGPAGSINSSVEEMLRYVQMHIDSGAYNGTEVLSSDNDVLMQRPQSIVGSPDLDPELGPATYGFGLSVTSYRGHKMVGHGGGIDGFISAMRWLPNERIGVVVLTNMSGEANPVPTLVAQRVIDDLMGLEPIDWNARTRQRVEEGRMEAAEERAKLVAEKITGTSPSYPLARYAGIYEHPGYGRIEIVAANNTLRVRFDQFNVALEHFHFDTFEIDAGRDMVPLEGRVQFLMNGAGKIDRLTVPFEPNLPPIVMQRVDTMGTEDGSSST